MSNEIHPTTDDLISLVFSGDPAIDREESDIVAYISSGGDEKHLVLTGEPTRYLFTPLKRRQRDFILGEEGAEANASIRGYTTVSLALHSIEGPEGTLLTEKQVRALKRRMGGLLRIGDDSELWEDSKLLPEGCATEVGNVAFIASFRPGGRADTDTSGDEGGPVVGA